MHLFPLSSLDPPRPCGMLHAAGVGMMGDPREDLYGQASRALAGVIELGEGIADRLAWEELLPAGWWRVRIARRHLSLMDPDDVDEALDDEEGLLPLDYGEREEWPPEPEIVDTPPL